MKKRVIEAVACVCVGALLFAGAKFLKFESHTEAEVTGTVITAEELLAATDYNVEEYVTLCDYKNLEVTLENTYEVTEDMVDSYLDNQILSQTKDYQVTLKQVVEDGDVANIDYVGTLDGVAFDGGSAEGYRLTIGSGTFIAGFEEGLIGAKVGETVDLNLTFPENYGSEELAGKDVVFKVTVNSIDEVKAVTVDSIDDKFVEENFAQAGLSTVSDLKNYTKEMLASNMEQLKRQEVQQQIEKVIVEKSEIKIPEGLVDKQVDHYIDGIKKAAEENEVAFEDYTGQTEEQLRELAMQNYSETIKTELVLEALVKELDVSVSEDEFNMFVGQVVSYYGFSSEEELYEVHGSREYIQLTFAENKVFDILYQMVKVNETDAPEPADETLSE